MREGKASSSDGSELDRRVFVSVRESSCTTLQGGDADLRDLTLDGEAKKSVRWVCVGDDSRCVVCDPGAEVRARLLQWPCTPSEAGIDLREISSWSGVSGCVIDDQSRIHTIIPMIGKSCKMPNTGISRWNLELGLPGHSLPRVYLQYNQVAR